MTSLVFDTLARFGVEVIDIEQIVLRRRLILGLLVSAPRDWKAAARPRWSGSPPSSDMTLELDARLGRQPARAPRGAAT